ncbi:MAG TPA: hypothetical protein VFS00_22790, partial [Polyangiaceae bacterium]|nr:hypothetical protein [Polyangiaceae bacterium]
GAPFRALAIAAVAFNEVLGPILFKYALDRAGETSGRAPARPGHQLRPPRRPGGDRPPLRPGGDRPPRARARRLGATDRRGRGRGASPGGAFPGRDSGMRPGGPIEASAVELEARRPAPGAA